ncbi:MAG: SDR family oxidoreductase [bacterium]
MESRVALVTGATSGIGKQTASELARQGFTVALGCRDPQRGEAARREIAAEAGSQRVSVLPVDLASLGSVRRAAAAFAGSFERLDVLVNNAGIFTMRQHLTEDGFEAQFGVNHLGHFLLTLELLDLLKRSAPSRVVVVSSAMHKGGRIDFDTFRGRRPYRPVAAYRQSKLANVLFTTELAGRLRGTGVTANALHPGSIATGIYRDAPLPVRAVVRLLLQAPRAGARTSVYLATSPEVAGTTGLYFEKSRPVATSREARDSALAERLWQKSEELCRTAT